MTKLSKIALQILSPDNINVFSVTVYTLLEIEFIDFVIDWTEEKSIIINHFFVFVLR